MWPYHLNLRFLAVVITSPKDPTACLILFLTSSFVTGKGYSGTKFFYTEPLYLNKAHSTKWKAFNNKTLYLYNHYLCNMISVRDAQKSSKACHFCSLYLPFLLCCNGPYPTRVQKNRSNQGTHRSNYGLSAIFTFFFIIMVLSFNNAPTVLENPGQNFLFWSFIRLNGT